MSSRFAIGLAGLLGLLAASCGSSSKDYMYSFSETGVCMTGELTFKSLAAMCTSLQSASANMNCGLAGRTDFFMENCPGTFTPTP